MKKATEGSGSHVPVLLEPSITGLKLKTDGRYLDGTFGRGGHSKAILAQLGEGGYLLAIDRDPQALAEADQALLQDPRFELVHGRFSELKTHASERDLLGKMDGLLLDLGVSSPQLDEAGRGFSFQHDGPLDMRMDPGQGESAAAWLATVKERDLRKVLFSYGEERNAVRIAKAIVAARDSAPVTRTAQLADIVSSVGTVPGQKKHPATRTFQAIRIFINNELGELESALHSSIDLLRAGGRLCVISFHSLEDRCVKRFMRTASRESEQYRGMPDVPPEHLPPLRLVGKAITATSDEMASNPRSRSARLRIAERV